MLSCRARGWLTLRLPQLSQKWVVRIRAGQQAAQFRFDFFRILRAPGLRRDTAGILQAFELHKDGVVGVGNG